MLISGIIPHQKQIHASHWFTAMGFKTHIPTFCGVYEFVYIWNVAMCTSANQGIDDINFLFHPFSHVTIVNK